ncbi:MAG: ImmA/IrrE family metallo-endopeptidase [Mogibacterium sp.]|nr:ImmA/IrrE family metallo-endopeptidase [Mogibacterium sp.]
MFAKNLKYYRLKKNMTKAALADACGVSPMAISNYESGKRKPDIEIINKMAEALDVHVVDFLSSRNAALSFSHGEFRKKTTLTKGEQEYVREAVEEYFNRFFTAVGFFGGDPLPVPPDCKCVKLSGNYEDDASAMRRYFDLPKSGPVEDIVAHIENKGFLVLFLDIDNDAFSGMNGFVNNYPYIVIRSTMNVMRKRTTIVHELAHLLFDWANSDLDEERHATAIAGAFLIPEVDLFRELGQRRSSMTRDMTLVCTEYGISTYLLAKRASQIGILSEGAARDFYIKANKAHWRTDEPEWNIKKEESNLFRQLVLRAVNEEDLGIQRAAELLKVPYADVQKYCVAMSEVNPWSI